MFRAVPAADAPVSPTLSALPVTPELLEVFSNIPRLPVRPVDALSTDSPEPEVSPSAETENTVPVEAVSATTLIIPVPVYVPLFVMRRSCPVAADESISNNASGVESLIPILPPDSICIRLTLLVPNIKGAAEFVPTNKAETPLAYNWAALALAIPYEDPVAVEPKTRLCIKLFVSLNTVLVAELVAKSDRTVNAAEPAVLRTKIEVFPESCAEMRAPEIGDVPIPIFPAVLICIRVVDAVAKPSSSVPERNKPFAGTVALVGINELAVTADVNVFAPAIV
jgi:hypothetical protein